MKLHQLITEKLNLIWDLNAESEPTFDLTQDLVTVGQKLLPEKSAWENEGIVNGCTIHPWKDRTSFQVKVAWYTSAAWIPFVVDVHTSPNLLTILGLANPVEVKIDVNTASYITYKIEEALLYDVNAYWLKRLHVKGGETPDDSVERIQIEHVP